MTRRELKEELGLDLHVGDLLCVDWVSPHGPWDDLINFIFDGGVLDGGQAASLKLLDGELAAFAFCTRHEAATRLRPYVWRRVSAVLDAVYLQDGYQQ